MNGCGGKGARIKAPNFIFEASCNKHDELYEKGGKEVDRFIADFLFWWYMNKDVNLFAKKYWYVYPLSYLLGFMWAALYCIAVRIGGKKYFNYK